MEKDLIFEVKIERGFTFTAWDLHYQSGDALMEIKRDGQSIKSFKLPTYIVRNLITDITQLMASDTWV